MIRNILIVEDDVGIQKYLKELFLDHGYSVKATADGVKALESIKKSQPDLVLLDLNLPDVSGESICLEIRKNYPNIRVIILTAKDTSSDIIQGLNLGADDYVTKPFIADELLARINARLRHTANDSRLKIADLELDDKTLEVKRGGRLIKLTPQEFKLLHYLMYNKGRILTRDMILNRIWPSSYDIETRVVDVYMGYLRKKIDSTSKKKLIYSARGFGYMLKE
ncbi:MAG: response regulator transcription factor [Candidatus Roizmanbacteria bacterium]|nr:MAG: response regulator transcription factor [Candidatus Roizmanbacteria bacterium]